jgi:thiamine kinase-like enzyme
MSADHIEISWPEVDLPGVLTFNKCVSQSIKSFIYKEISSFSRVKKDTIRKLNTPSNGKDIAGRYYLETENSRFFLKITKRIGFPEIEKDLLDHARDNDVSVNKIEFYKTVYWNSTKYRIEMRSFLEGRHFNGSISDLISVSKNLKKLHGSLRGFLRKNEIYQNAGEKFTQLQKIQTKLKNNIVKNDFNLFPKYTSWAIKNKKWLSQMAYSFNPFFHEHSRAQCIHGEIHPANVIFDQSGKAVFIDFEESPHIYAVPEWDIAYFIQRFCMRDNPSQRILNWRINIVRQEYGQFSNLALIMRQLAWYSIAVILYLRHHADVLVPLSEYKKFVQLEKQAQMLEGLI